MLTECTRSWVQVPALEVKIIPQGWGLGGVGTSLLPSRVQTSEGAEKRKAERAYTVSRKPASILDQQACKKEVPSSIPNRPKNIHKETWSPRFPGYIHIAFLKHCSQHLRQCMNRWMDKEMWRSYMTTLHAAEEETGIMTLAGKGTDLENVIFSEISQT